MSQKISSKLSEVKRIRTRRHDGLRTILTKTAGLMDLRTLQRLKIKERSYK